MGALGLLFPGALGPFGLLPGAPGAPAPFGGGADLLVVEPGLLPCFGVALGLFGGNPPGPPPEAELVLMDKLEG